CEWYWCLPRPYGRCWIISDPFKFFTRWFSGLNINQILSKTRADKRNAQIYSSNGICYVGLGNCDYFSSIFIARNIKSNNTTIDDCYYWGSGSRSKMVFKERTRYKRNIILT